MAVTNGWGQATQNNTNGFGKYQNTIDAGSVYADSYAGETSLEGTSAAFSYSASSYHQGEADPTPTITGTAGGTFSATPSGLSINTSTGTIDLDNSTIQSYTITYTVSGVSSSQSLSVTASPFLANTYSMQFDSASSQYVDLGTTLNSMLELGDSFSVSAWVNFGNTAADRTIISNFTSAIKGFQFRVLPAESIRIIIAEAGNKYLFVDSTSLAINTWHHAVFTYDGSNTIGGLNLYINSSLDNNTTGTSGTITSITSTDSLKIGAYTSGDYFDGKLDEVAIWNVALSSDAVTEIYNATNNNTGKALDLSTDYNNYTSSSNLQYWTRLGD